MSGIDNSITLGVGEISFDSTLGCYYQNIAPAIIHINNKKFASLDEHGIPYYISGNEKKYSIVLVIQYGQMCFDLMKKGIDEENNFKKLLKCVEWLDSKSEFFIGTKIWRSESNDQYQLDDGWVSGMYQGQALSLYLRAYQLLEKPEYLNSAELIFKSFFITYEQGGFVRKDNFGNLWFEEYPGKEPSFVLNGFIYAMFGILDFYRVTKNPQALAVWEDCVNTLEKNLHKYDVWYWSLYDQLKKELVSYYYMKNVHIPLMEIMYLLTNKEIFNKFAKKWKKSLNNRFHKIVVQIMYRIRPRLLKIKSNAKCK